jgi:hypothetical protein
LVVDRPGERKELASETGATEREGRDGHKEWREKWLNEITKTRAIDGDFKKRIDSDRVFTCEKHFDPKDIEICK